MGLAAAAAGAGGGEEVVVAPVLEFALGLASSSAVGVQELAALSLLPPKLLSVEYDEFLPDSLQTLLQVSIQRAAVLRAIPGSVLCQPLLLFVKWLGF